MSSSGVLTHDFLTRLEKFGPELPPLLVELATMMRRMIEEIDRPQLEDVQRLHGEFHRKIRDRVELTAICGREGKLCPQCPFGAYLPSGFPFASEDKPLCLPWITILQPQAWKGRPADAE